MVLRVIVLVTKEQREIMGLSFNILDSAFISFALTNWKGIFPKKFNHRYDFFLLFSRSLFFKF